MENSKKLIYFPETYTEIDEYVERLLCSTLKENYEKEKTLLYCILKVMFKMHDSDIIGPLNIKRALYLHFKVFGDLATGLDMIFDKYQASIYSSDDIDDIYGLYNALCKLEDFDAVVFRLLNIFQFYDNLFDTPVFSNDGSTLIRYPNHLSETTYRIPKNVTKIAKNAFSYNENIQYIKIHENVLHISAGAFRKCNSLKGIIVNDDNLCYYSNDGVLFDKKNNMVLKYPSGCLTKIYAFPKKAKGVESFAFEDCIYLVGIEIEQKDFNVKNGAFINCPILKHVYTLNCSFKDLNKRGFENCGKKLVESNKRLSPDLYDDLLPDEIAEIQQFEEYEEETQEKAEQIDTNNIDKNLPTPSQIKKNFDDYIIGHDDVKKTIAVAVYSHFLRCSSNVATDDVSINKSNILLCGPTGCGKTEFARTIAKFLKVPFVTVDATSITETGYKGNEPTDMLFDLINAADGDIEKAENGIIYIDEIDKLAATGINAHRESYSKGVQQSLLKIVEGGVISLKKDIAGRSMQCMFNTNNVLFIIGGAFSGLTDKYNVDTPQATIGFGDNATVKAKEFKNFDVHDFIKYGMIPEFMGRFPVVCNLKQLTEEQIYRIMIEPKNSVVSQYKKLVSKMGAELIFEDELLRKIATNAVKTNTGARGIRTVIENLIEDVLFVLPDMENVEKVVMHEKMFTNKESAKFIIKEENTKETESSESNKSDGVKM